MVLILSGYVQKVSIQRKLFERKMDTFLRFERLAYVPPHKKEIVKEYNLLTQVDRRE
jgi:hypothetical protein